MYLLILKQFLRTKTCQLGLALGLVLGVISIITGKQFLNHQDKIATQVETKQQEHINRNVKFHHDDLGLLLYYLKFTLVNQHDPLVGLSIGQKDLNPSVQSVNILTLEGQKYDTDLVNPSKLLHGNLDFSFVLIYIFPLLIIAFIYNLRSEEEELGTWKIVNVMAKSTKKFLLTKLLVRLTIILSLLCFLLFLACLVLNIALNQLLIAFFATGVFYVLFWFAICFWIVSLKRSSNFNALILLSFWLLLVVLIPAVVNNHVANRFPVPEAFTTFIQQRDGYHQKWDENKRETMDKFYASYPQLTKFGYPPEDGFSWHWYYAMQHMGDAESQSQSEAMQTKIKQRNAVSDLWAKFIPSLHTQLIFNKIVGSDLINHLKFLQYIGTFHEDTRLYFYPKIFLGESAQEVAWEQFKPTYFKDKQSIDWLNILGPLIIATLVFLGLSMFLMSRNR